MFEDMGYTDAQALEVMLAVSTRLIGRGIEDGSYRGWLVEASDAVVAKTAAALGTADWADDLSMARALMRAMDAGAAAGGDRRCGKANSDTAFIALYRESDPEDAPWVTLAVNGLPTGIESGMAHLDKLFAQWLATGTDKPSTRKFVEPIVAGPGK